MYEQLFEFEDSSIFFLYDSRIVAVNEWHEWQPQKANNKNRICQYILYKLLQKEIIVFNTSKTAVINI